MKRSKGHLQAHELSKHCFVHFLPIPGSAVATAVDRVVLEKYIQDGGTLLSVAQDSEGTQAGEEGTPRTLLSGACVWCFGEHLPRVPNFGAVVQVKRIPV